jgi:hypothetical protein
MVREKLVSFEEIGQKLGITRQQAFKDYRRGMAKLKKLMKRNSKLRNELLSYLNPRKGMGSKELTASKVLANIRQISDPHIP